MLALKQWLRGRRSTEGEAAVDVWCWGDEAEGEAAVDVWCWGGSYEEAMFAEVAVEVCGVMWRA